MPVAATSQALKYKQLRALHPDYKDLCGYWAELRALYEGGKALLRNPEILERLFPQHSGETPESYTERKRRAYYVAHFGSLIDFVVCGLSTDPLRMIPPGKDEQDESKLDEFWKAYLDDCSPPLGEKQPFGDLMRELARTGLVLGRYAALVDLPSAPEGYVPASEADQLREGLLDAYSVQLAPEAILNWSGTQDGVMRWVMVHGCERVQGHPADPVLKRETYTLYTPEYWTRWVVEYDEDQTRASAKKKPQDDDDIGPAASAGHSFGAVPVVYRVLKPALWMGNKLHSLAVEHLNKACGLAWAEYKALYQQLYEFLGPEIPGIDTPVATVQMDPSRAVRQRRGIGTVQIRGQDDDAKYVGPETAGNEQAEVRIEALRKDMYRVTHQMALESDVSGAMLRRAEGSKKQDGVATKVVLGALGDTIRDGAEEVIDRAACGRGDIKAGGPGWTAAGMEKFDSVEISDAIEQAAVMETVPIPSATYQVERKFRLAKQDLGDAATPEMLTKIRTELEGALTQDQLQAAGDVAAGLADPVGEAAAERDAEAAEKAAEAAAKAPVAKPGKRVAA